MYNTLQKWRQRTHFRIVIAVNNSSQSQVLAVANQMSDVTVQPTSEPELDDDEEDDEDEDDDEDWAWHSSAGNLTKRYNRAGLNSQVCRNADQPDYWLLYIFLLCPCTVIGQANRQNLANKSLPSTPTDKALRKYENKINLGNTPSHAHTFTPEYHHINSTRIVVLCCFMIVDKLNYADSVINKVTLMQKQKDADTYVHAIVNVVVNVTCSV